SARRRRGGRSPRCGFAAVRRSSSRAIRARRAAARAVQTRKARWPSSCCLGLDVDQRDEEVFEAGVLVAVLLTQLAERAFGDEAALCDHADAVGHAFGNLEDVSGHDHGAAGTDAIPAV